MAESMAQPGQPLKKKTTKSPQQGVESILPPVEESPPSQAAPRDSETGEQAVSDSSLPELSGKFRLKVGEGLTSEVDADKLRDSYLKRQEAEQLMKQAQQLIQKNARAAEVAELLDKLPNDQRQAFLQAVQSGELTQSGSRNQSRRDVDEFLEEAEGQRNGDRSKSPDKMQLLEKAVVTMLQRFDAMDRNQHEQTVGQKIESELKQFDQFNPDKTGDDRPLKFLKQSVMNAYLASGGKTDPGQLAVEMASQYSETLPVPEQFRQTSQSEGSRQYRRSVVDDDFSIPRPATAQDIVSGQGLRNLLEDL